MSQITLAKKILQIAKENDALHIVMERDNVFKICLMRDNKEIYRSKIVFNCWEEACRIAENIVDNIYNSWDGVLLCSPSEYVLLLETEESD